MTSKPRFLLGGAITAGELTDVTAMETETINVNKARKISSIIEPPFFCYVIN